MTECTAKSISDYLGQYFTGAAHATGSLASMQAIKRNNSAYRALKIGVKAAIDMRNRTRGNHEAAI